MRYTTINTLSTRDLESERESLLSDLEDLISNIPCDPEDEDYLSYVEDLVKWLDVPEDDHLEFIGGQVWMDGWDECLRYARSDEAGRLTKLNSMRDEVYDWDDGVTLILEDDFEDYAKDHAVDCGATIDGWPYDHIDWAAATEDMAKDYTSVQYDGDTYLYRS